MSKEEAVSSIEVMVGLSPHVLQFDDRFGNRKVWKLPLAASYISCFPRRTSIPALDAAAAADVDADVEHVGLVDLLSMP